MFKNKEEKLNKLSNFAQGDPYWNAELWVNELNSHILLCLCK